MTDSRQDTGNDSKSAIAVSESLKKSRVALFIQLADLFRNRIATGQWPVGSRIPNIDQLEREFKVARGTVRQAFNVLKEEGLVEQRRAKGSFVLKSPAPVHTHRLEMDWNAIINAHVGAQILTLSSETGVPMPDVLRDGAPLAAAYHRFKRLHRKEGQAYLLGTSYLDVSLYEKIPAAQFEDQPLLVQLQELAGDDIGSANQTLTVHVADVETAAALEIPINSPVVLMHRRVHSRAGVLIFASEGLYRGDVVRLEMTIR